MNVDAPIADARRSEVVATVSPSGTGPNSPSMPLSCRPLRGSARPARPTPAPMHHTYPELARARQCRLVVVGVEIGGRFGTETVQLLRLLARHKAMAVPAASRPAAITACPGSWQSQPSTPLLPLSLSLPSSEKAQSPSCTNSSPRRAGMQHSRLCPTPAALGAAM